MRLDCRNQATGHQASRYHGNHREVAVDGGGDDDVAAAVAVAAGD